MFNEYYENLLPLLYKKAHIEDFQESQPKLVEFSKGWLRRPESIFISGPFGVGKTHFVYALLRELAIRNPNAWPLFYSSPNLDSILLEGIKSDQGDRYQVKKASEAEVLVIDDIGRETKTERLRRQLFEIINYRYSHCKITIMTSNWNPEDLQEIFEDAVLSRIQTWNFIEITGNDRRKAI